MSGRSYLVESRIQSALASIRAPFAARWVVLGAAVALGAVPLLALAQEAVQVQPEVENSRFQFSGAINSGDVYVRSGPGEAYYTTMKLPQSTPVTVVGIKYDWLKILPPDGSFCYVGKLYIDRTGDGSVGRVNRPGINVRAGSVTNAMKTTVLARLNVGDEVKIVGEQDEYYKIAPPPGSYLYVNKQFVDPVKALAVNAAPVDPVASTDGASAPPADSAPADATARLAPLAATDGSTTQPSDVIATATPAAVATVIPATQPAAPSPSDLAAADFAAAEADFAAASKKPLEEQPIAGLADRFDKLMKNAALPETDRETAGFRVAVLKVRENAQTRLAEVNKTDAEAATRTQNLKAEQDELQQRLLANDVKLYAAVGSLQPSSLQFGADTLYRLADPATGRTVIYIKGDSVAAVKLMGQFVGVRGDAVSDDKLNIRVIPFTLIEPVDPTLLNSKVVAGIMPPSLVAHAVQASAGN